MGRAREGAERRPVAGRRPFDQKGQTPAGRWGAVGSTPVPAVTASPRGADLPDVLRKLLEWLLGGRGYHCQLQVLKEQVTASTLCQ